MLPVRRFDTHDEDHRPLTSLQSHARRAEARDALKAKNLVQNYTKDVFGEINREENVSAILEHSIFSLTLEDGQGRVLAVAAFYDYPNIHKVPSDDWENKWWNVEYPNQLANIKANAINTLFLHLFVSEPDFSEGCAEELINVTFKALPEINQILLCVPRIAVMETALSKYFQPVDSELIEPSCNLMVCHRKDHFPALFIRRARVQDNDDLAPLFNQYNEILRQTYGDFFVAELIESQDENNKALVAECNGYAIGFMSVSTEVNIDVLNEVYALSAFHGLRASHPDDQWNEQMTEEVEGFLPNADISTGADGLSHADDPHNHVKSNPTLEAMQRAAGGVSTTEVSTDVSHISSANGTATSLSDKLTKPSKSIERQNEHPSLNGSDYATTSINKSTEDFSNEQGDETVETNDHNDAVLEILDTSSHRARMTKAQLAAEDPSKYIKPKLIGQTPKFFGRPKAFAIQLFCISEVYEKRSYDFLQKAFEMFPDRDYCVISIPHLVPEFPLLQSFIRIPPRVNVPNIQELYLFHRAGLFRDIQIERASEKHFDAVKRLTEHFSSRDKIHKDFLDAVRSGKRSDNGTFIDAHVIKIADQTNAVIIYSNEEDIDFLRSQYNLEEFIYFTLHKRTDHIHIYHFVINPIFAYMTRLFIKEILRKIRKSTAFYPIFPRYADDELLKHHSPTYAVHYLLPVRPRRLVQYNLEKLQTNAPTDTVLGRLPHLSHSPFALNFTARKSILEPRITVNARIVIVGASTVSLSVLEALTTSSYLRFNNLTLISPHGLPGEFPPAAQRDSFLPSNLDYENEEISRLSLRSYVNIICAKVVGLNRPMRLAILDDDTVVPYDHLLLCTGNQFRIIAPMDATVVGPLSKNPFPPKPDRFLFDPAPLNVLTVNDEFDAAMALKWLRMNHNVEHSIIVYGNTLESYCCVNTLIMNGVPPKSIKLIFPPTENSFSIFNDPIVLKSVLGKLKDLEVEIHENYIMESWNHDSNTDPSEPIETVVFLKNEKSLRPALKLKCTTLFCFYNKQVDYEAFMAINQSSLVFDGRLVIDENDRTNDPSIFAAGPLTKFKRIYHRENWTHVCSNSREVGKMLADKIFEQYDPIFVPPTPKQRKQPLIPMFNRPKKVYALLPGNLHYLHISKPEPLVNYEEMKNQEDYGVDLVTNQNDNYFRIHLDPNGVVRTIVCLHHQPMDIHNIGQLYGLHERLLNNLRQRYKENLIKDFFEYFKQSWAVALFHDRFNDVRNEVRDVLKQALTAENDSLFSTLDNTIDQDMIFNDEQRKSILTRFRTEGYKKEVEEILLRYLNYNQYHLPMYARPT